MWEQSDRGWCFQGVTWGQWGDWLSGTQNACALCTAFTWLPLHDQVKLLLPQGLAHTILWAWKDLLLRSWIPSWVNPHLSFDSQLKCPLLKCCLIVQTMAAMWHNSILGTLHSGVVWSHLWISLKPLLYIWMTHTFVWLCQYSIAVSFFH